MSRLQTSSSRIRLWSLDANMSFPPSVRHVDTSGLPQFSVSEERVIGLNESRAVFRDFEENGGFNNIPITFVKLATSKGLRWSYQQATTCKVSVRAILCDRGNSAGALPTKRKPNHPLGPYIVRQVDNNTHTIVSLLSTRPSAFSEFLAIIRKESGVSAQRKGRNGSGA